ncbi:MAG TPA: 2OG-Fe(II) oxygenase [Vicinamibacterales bacterium]|nr:2OG-Fe(II) oxygenase [Vicinamibacterales bacterium]
MVLSIFTAPDVMDAPTCRRVQGAMDAGVPEPAEVLHDTISVQEEVRRASEIDVPDVVLVMVETCLDRMLDSIAAFYRLSLQSREGPSFLRYETGGFYKPHVDRARVPSWPATARRQVTMVLFLESSRDAEPAGGFSGGLLRLFPDGAGAPIDITPTRGTVVAFPAAMRHEVTPVTSGRRDTVVDWFY